MRKNTKLFLVGVAIALAGYFLYITNIPGMVD